MSELTRTERARYAARRLAGKLGWRLRIGLDEAAVLVLVGTIAGGIYAATATAQAWPGAWVAAGALIVAGSLAQAFWLGVRDYRRWDRADRERSELLAWESERIFKKG